MTKNRWFYPVLGGMLLLSAAGIGAQQPPAPSPQSPDVLMPGGPFGGRMEILGFGEMHPGKVVTGAPYSATAVVETKQTLADGNSINRKSQTNVYRDGQGRTRRETTLSGIGPLAAQGQPRSFVMIHDPVSSSAFVLHPDTKSAEKLPVPPGGRRRDALHSRFQERMQREMADGTLKTEDLGVQTIAGVSAQGTRYTRTIPAGQIGNERAITITGERWYSPDLQIVVRSTRSDPRFGETSYTITNLQRAEPASTLFTVPTDYTVTSRQRHFGHRGAPMMAPGGAVPPPGE